MAPFADDVFKHIFFYQRVKFYLVHLSGKWSESGLYIVSVIELPTVTITYNMYTNVFEENSEKCTAQSRVKDSFRGCRPAPGANSWFPHVVMSTCTPQPRAFTIKCRVNLAVVSHIGLRIGCSSVVIPNGIWILKKKRMVGNPLRIKPITIKIHWCATKAASTWHVLIKKIWSVYSSVPSYSYGQITAQSVSIRPYRDRRSGRIIACANLIFPHCPF